MKLIHKWGKFYTGCTGLHQKEMTFQFDNPNTTTYRGVNENNKEYVWFVMVPLPYELVNDIPEEFETSPYVLKGEELGPLDFYREEDILNKKYRTSRNLTDFINYLTV